MWHYLDTLWGTWDDPEAGVLPVWDAASKASDFLPIHDLDASTECAARHVEQGWSGHIGMALQPHAPASGRGKEETACAIAGLWCDVDVQGPTHRQEDLPATTTEAVGLIHRAIQPKPSLLVDSGYGAHAYWLFHEPWDFRIGEDDVAERMRARLLCDQLQRAIREEARRAGFAIDATSDLSRVLRIPGSLNTKIPDDPRPVRVIGESGLRYGVEELEEALPAIPSKERRQSPRPFTGVEIPARFDAIMNGCAFMRHARDAAAELTYGEWHAALTIAARSEDGERHTHELSAPYPDYDPAETQAKYTDARDSNKPYRCATIAILSTEAAACCALCPHRGMISTPVQLGRPRTPRPQLTETVPLQVIGSPTQTVHANGQHATGEETAETRPTGESVADQRCNLTDLGNAERLVDAHGQDIRYSHALKRWFAWGEKHWAEDDSGAVMRHAKATARAIYGEAERAATPDHAKAIAKHAMTSQSAQRLKAMVELAQSEAGIPISPNDLDQDPWLLNVANGILDLRSGELRKHRRKAYLSKLAPVAYDPNALCTTFLAFLDRIMGGDQALIDFLQRAAGYSLTGDTSERVVFILHGIGRNGKTTFVEALRSPLGHDYTARASTDTLLARRFEQIPNDLAALRGKRFVSASEVNQGRRLDEAKIKDITGGDSITARFMRGEWFDYKPQFKLWLSTNHKPVIRGTDEGIWDRIRLVPFDVRIPEDEIDRSLGQKLREEAPGILAWMVDGCLQWQERGLDPPEKVSTATQTYRTEMDLLGEFLADRCVLAAHTTAKVGDLYTTYSVWARENGEEPITKNAFGRQLTERGFTQKRATGGERWWQGIGILGVAAPTEFAFE
jgi:putative DNA primase/helicase